MRIAIDAGHGGHDSGAVAPDGAKEKDVVLDYAFQLERLFLAAGHEVLLTRKNDDFVGLSLRAQRADDWGADCLLSIHANAASNEAANGAWVIYDDKTSRDNGIALARAIFDEMSLITGVADADEAEEVYPDGTAWVGNRQLTVISAARCSAVLIELGFLTNPGDLADLLKPGVEEEICDAIVLGTRIWGFGKGLIESPEYDEEMVDSLPLDFKPAPFPQRMTPLMRSPARPAVQAFAKPNETTGNLFVRLLQGVVDDEEIMKQLGGWAPVVRWACLKLIKAIQ